MKTPYTTAGRVDFLHRPTRFVAALLLTGSVLAGCTTPGTPVTHAPLTGPYQPPARGLARSGPGHAGAMQSHAAPLPADTSARGMAAVWADVRRRSYFLDARRDGPAGTRSAGNAAQHLAAELAATTYTVSALPDSATRRPAWAVAFRLRGIGRVGAAGLPLPAPTASPTGTGDSATYGAGQAVAIDYRNSPAGVRQTFRLARRPAGKGAVRVRLDLATALHPAATPDGTALAFSPATGGGGPVLCYAGLSAWDATGRCLPAHLALHGHTELALVVEDEGATYPITIDPLASTPGTTLASPATNDSYGRSVAGAGDVNGDGYADVVIGASDTNINQGMAYLYLGSSTGLATTPATILADPANTTLDYFGYSVAGAGDVNGDGYADVVIGAYGTNGTQGKAYLYLGSSTGLPTTPATTLADPAAASVDYFGGNVAGAGDVNGDGYADVVIGASGTSSKGRAYVYLGSSTGLATVPATTLTDPAATNNDYFGYGVASAGDVNGDGYADVVVGANGTTGLQGKAYLYLGSSTGLATVPATTLADPAAASNDQFGRNVAGAGDVNGDGYADVVIGAFNTNGAQGRAYVYLGSSTGLAATPTTTLVDPAATNNDYFGYGVAGAGDVNGDGYADVVIGAYGASNIQGRAYLYLGSSTGLPTTPATTLADPPAANNDSFGYSVAGAGDVNGDGYADVVAGAFNTSTNIGASYVYYGSTDVLLATAAATLLDPNITNGDRFGFSVAGAGDVNGDGYADVVIGAYGTNGFQGRAYLYLGSSTGLATTPAATLLDPAATGTDYFGYSVASAGDVNGDGYADVVIGALGASSTQGRAYLYLGSSAGLAIIPTILADPLAISGDFFGYSVSDAGDVNGDGYADVVIGAFNTNGAQGRAYVYLGSSTGLAATPTTTLVDPAATSNDNFGYSVSDAGDVNGDGYADVVIGAYGTTNAQGKAYVYLGGSTGLATTPVTTLADPMATSNNQFGFSVAVAGDVNGDGYTDVVVGAYGTNGNQGKAYLYLGGNAGLATTPAATLADPNATINDYFGYSVAGAGDVNGDGYADVVIGAYGTTGLQGKTYVFRGSSTGLATTPAATLADPNATNNDYFGSSVAGAGDVNGDGYADVVIGAYNISSSQGRSYLYLGNLGVARRGGLRLYNTDLSTPISAANHTTPLFGLGLVARSPFGRVKARLVWETVGNGLSFSHNSPITNSTASTGHGPWTSLPAGTLTELKSLVYKAGHATRVRARLEYASAALTSSAVAGTGGVGAQARYGPWVYVQNQQLGQSASTATPLPVELALFTAKSAGATAVQLAWSTASEANSAGFAVERSLDGVVFQKIGAVDAAGHSVTTRTYAYLDDHLPDNAAMLYYRLRLQDLDGTFSLSPVRSVARTKAPDELPQLLAYPNPARTLVSVRLLGSAPATAPLELVDGLGRVVRTLPAPAPGTELALPLTNIPGGLYVLRCGALSQRVVVE